MAFSKGIATTEELFPLNGMSIIKKNSFLQNESLLFKSIPSNERNGWC